MIKANELRIGQWYNEFGRDFQLEADQINFFVSSGCLPSGIPITEDFLLKVGFEKEIRLSFFIKNDKKFVWILNYDDQPNIYYIPKIMGSGIEIKYVHQLQNLYFAITNEELTFKTN